MSEPTTPKPTSALTRRNEWLVGSTEASMNAQGKIETSITFSGSYAAPSVVRFIEDMKPSTAGVSGNSAVINDTITELALLINIPPKCKTKRYPKPHKK